MELRSTCCLFFLFLLFFLSPSSSIGGRHRARARSLFRSAESLIRDLNLLPGIQELGAEIEAENLSSPRLVERRLSLPILGQSGSEVPVEQLGHYAGYYRLEHTHAAKMFYFFFESRGKSTDPVVIWLTGGPGCSSELALFYENGPFKIANNLSLVWNDYGWDKVSNIIFVDQPTGTGFSYSTDLRDLRYGEKGVSNDLYDFLQAFFKEHQDFLNNDFYITGESYAGHYIPAAAERVHTGNKEKQGLKLNLKGFAIGNGLTDPSIQYGAYADYALEMGIITERAHNSINKIYPLCQLGIKLCGSSGVISCAASLVVCESIFNSIMLLAGDINYYDIRKKCEGSLCYDFSNMEKFLNQESVRKVLGVGNRKFVSCSPLVYRAMITDWMKNLEVGIPALLEDGIKLMVYAGEYDLICNWLGNFRWVSSMEWSGSQIFNETALTQFKVDGKEAGLFKTFGPLTFLKVHDAGHMVPMDQPKAALQMLEKWMEGSLNEELVTAVATM
ncbi:serine carboxypeptidase-like [Zingiber officinale]|uniref:serine carboxypeptidase-like n=1 Tax=Zingiber officinale TaxID=94328 RepID=UPI001C4C0A6A|nr:serine carboxypeptidase-like [Zingiber officinale]